jgi:hypothetical protein
MYAISKEDFFMDDSNTSSINIFKYISDNVIVNNQYI